MMILAIVTRDPARLGRGGDLVTLLGLPHLRWPRSFDEAKLAMLLRVAATLISWLIL
jgi:hypothetical protein